MHFDAIGKRCPAVGGFVVQILAEFVAQPICGDECESRIFKPLFFVEPTPYFG